MAKRKAFWADTRFFIGIALIVASVAGVCGVVASARRTVPVFAAADTIVAGEALVASDVVVIETHLGAAIERYLPAREGLDGLVARRTVGEGELLPAAAVAESTDQTTIVVTSAAEVPSGVAAGTMVELWSAPAVEAGFDTPRILVPDAVVGEIRREESMVSSVGTSVELVLDRSAVAEVLGAISSGAALSVVPVGSTG